jgi:hypothetical protein
MKALGAFIAYMLVKQLSKPWEEWDAFKLGLIDNKGKTLKKASNAEEKSAMNTGTILAKNIKKLMQRIPFGQSKLASLAAALYLVKENNNIIDDESFDIEIRKHINIIDEHILPESNNIEVLTSGKYQDEDKNVFIIKEDQEPIGSIFEVALYEVYDIIHRDRFIISQEQLTRID